MESWIDDLWFRMAPVVEAIVDGVESSIAQSQFQVGTHREGVSAKAITDLFRIGLATLHGHGP